MCACHVKHIESLKLFGRYWYVQTKDLWIFWINFSHWCEDWTRNKGKVTHLHRDNMNDTHRIKIGLSTLHQLRPFVICPFIFDELIPLPLQWLQAFPPFPPHAGVLTHIQNDRHIGQQAVLLDQPPYHLQMVLYWQLLLVTVSSQQGCKTGLKLTPFSGSMASNEVHWSSTPCHQSSFDTPQKCFNHAWYQDGDVADSLSTFGPLVAAVWSGISLISMSS